MKSCTKPFVIQATEPWKGEKKNCKIIQEVGVDGLQFIRCTFLHSRFALLRSSPTVNKWRFIKNSNRFDSKEGNFHKNNESMVISTSIFISLSVPPFVRSMQSNSPKLCCLDTALEALVWLKLWRNQKKTQLSQLRFKKKCFETK